MLIIITATRKSRAEFDEGPLGQSLRRITFDKLVNLFVRTENSRGLPAVYNEFITEQYREHELVFIHDDVWLDDIFFTWRVREGLEAFDVIGLAGNRILRPDSPTWCVKDNTMQFDMENLSGVVCHGASPFGKPEVFGQAPARVQLLDGLMIAARACRLLDAGVRFDERFDFHFYDLDFSRQANAAGLTVGVWPISITHVSRGSLSDSWRRGLGIYRSKWNNASQVFNQFTGADLDDKALLHKVGCLTIAGRYKEAFESSGEYLKRFGEDYNICVSLMDLYHHVDDGESCFAYYKKAIARCDDPRRRLKAGGLLLLADLYHGSISDDEFPNIVDDMRRCTEKLQTNTVFDNTLKPFKKIKIGYLSADFRRHPVGHFLLPVMAKAISSHSFNVCFNLSQRNDDITEQFKSLSDVFVEVYGQYDANIEKLFMMNKIDIAFDMQCHSENNRVWLYARRLAPLQISWIGLPVTTGVAAMDYVITDKNADPPGSEKYYTEKLLYMPECFLCGILTGLPPTEPPAVTRNGYITFACFHNHKKITDKSLRMWRRILERCENSRLKILGCQFISDEDRDIFHERVGKIGLPMERVNILPMLPAKEYFAAYNDVDIMVDTYPFSGATTTFDALRMGRPIITLVGDRHVTRVSYSLLKRVGLEDLAAFSEDEYVEKAVTLAGDHERLRKINAELPRRVEESPLSNQTAFQKNFEKIIRDAWLRHCFENRKGYYDYSADSLPELLEQVVNATFHIERKLDAGENIEGALAAEYHRAQKAFCEKLNAAVGGEVLINGYKNLVRVLGRRLNENDLRQALSTAKRYLNVF